MMVHDGYGQLDDTRVKHFPYFLYLASTNGTRFNCRKYHNWGHAEPELLCVAVGNPAICVNGQSTDGGAMAWNLAHQRHGSNELLLCECAFFPVLFVCAIQRVSGYEDVLDNIAGGGKVYAFLWRSSGVLGAPVKARKRLDVGSACWLVCMPMDAALKNAFMGRRYV
nr:hypothetical protein HmN_000138200 [Hymenolepis microstoma]